MYGQYMVNIWLMKGVPESWGIPHCWMFVAGNPKLKFRMMAWGYPYDLGNHHMAMSRARIIRDSKFV